MSNTINQKYLSVSDTKSILAPDKDGRPLQTIENFCAIMANDRNYSAIRYNEMTGCAEVHNKDTITRWTDADEARSMMYIESKYGLYSKDKHSAALRILFEERAYNPIKDIVDAQKWDGQERCRFFLRDWAKVEDTDYSREVSRLIFAGGIHRLYRLCHGHHGPGSGALRKMVRCGPLPAVS